MRFYFFILSSIFFSLGAQNSSKEIKNKSQQNNNKWELARTIVTQVIIRDTTTIGTILRNWDSTTKLNEYTDNTFEKFIDPNSFYQLKTSITKIAKSKNAIVYKN